jgi:ATP-dependent Zn protease
MQRILTEGYAETEKKLQIHMDKLVAVAERLMITEKMDGDEFLKIMESSNELAAE